MTTGVEDDGPRDGERDSLRDEAARLRHRAARLRRFRTAIVLFIVFALLLVIANALYPRRAPVSRPPLYTVTLVQHVRLTALILDVAQRSAGNYSVTPYAPVASNTGSSTSAVTLALTPSVPVRNAYCTPVCRVTVDKKTKEATFHLSTVSFRDVPFAYGYVLPTIWFTTSSFAWDTNGLQLEATMPSVTVDGCATGCSTSALAIEPTYELANGGRYTWSGGPPPASVIPTQVSWSIPAAQLSAPSTVSATNLSEQDSDNLRTFAAGAVLGIAGGALIGAVQEFMDSEARSSASRAARRRKRAARDGK